MNHDGYLYLASEWQPYMTRKVEILQELPDDTADGAASSNEANGACHDVIRLMPTDQALFALSLSTPPASTDALSRAFERRRQLLRDSPE